MLQNSAWYIQCYTTIIFISCYVLGYFTWTIGFLMQRQICLKDYFKKCLQAYRVA